MHLKINPHYFTLSYTQHHGVLPCREVKPRLEASEDVDLSAGPDLEDGRLDPVYDPQPDGVLGAGGDDPLEEVLDLLVEPERDDGLYCLDGTNGGAKKT